MGPNGTNGQHIIIPATDTITRPDGSPVSLLDYSDYPAIAECMRCGQPIHCEIWLKTSWLHAEAVIPEQRSNSTQTGGTL
jgi:hypothetical protein